MTLFLRYFLVIYATSTASMGSAAAWSAWRGAPLRTGSVLVLTVLAGIVSAAAARLLASRTGRSLRDIEELYLQEKAQVQTLVYNIPDGIVILNLRGEILHINAPAMSMLGVRPEDVEKPARGFFEIVRQGHLRMSVQKILKSRTRSEVVEVPPADGDVPGAGPRYYHTSVTLFSGPQNEEVGILLMMRDVTMEQALIQMKEELFHSVAHDLRAPIFAVQGYLRLVEKETRPDPKLRGYFDAIYQSCEKLILFIQDILDTHRLESGQMTLNVAALEPGAFLERLKGLYEPVAGEKGIRLELSLAEGGPPSVEGDDRLLERVFNNLISNALKHTPRGGTIRISAARAGEGMAQFSVADTGPGIPRDKRVVIFEKFKQLDAKQSKAGFGLGLNICRKIVELHRGEIWVESEPGKGSEFVFRIPLRQRDA